MRDNAFLRVLGMDRGTTLSDAAKSGDAKLAAERAAISRVRPEKILPEGSRRTLTLPDGSKREAELIGNDWYDVASGAPMYYKPSVDFMGRPVGAPTINPAIYGKAETPADPLDALNNEPGKPGTDKGTDKPRVRVQLKDLR